MRAHRHGLREILMAVADRGNEEECDGRGGNGIQGLEDFWGFRRFHETAADREERRQRILFLGSDNSARGATACSRVHVHLEGGLCLLHLLPMEHVRPVYRKRAKTVVRTGQRWELGIFD